MNAAAGKEYAHAVAIWLTGLSGAGKSTLAHAIHGRFKEAGLKAEILDGDEVRARLSRELGYSRSDRNENIERIGYVASLLVRNGVFVIVAAISPYRESRESSKSMIGTCVEVYCRCPLSVAEARDVKGLYRRARQGEIKNFTGIDDPYEEPLHPEVLVETGRDSTAQCMETIWRALQERGYVPASSQHSGDSRLETVALRTV